MTRYSIGTVEEIRCPWCRNPQPDLNERDRADLLRAGDVYACEICGKNVRIDTVRLECRLVLRALEQS